MRLAQLAVLMLCGTLASPAHAQFLSERPDGRQRVCIYRDAASTAIDTNRTREYRVGLGQNCPILPPGIAQGLPPPTARFVSETISGASRICIYEEAGQSWRSPIPVGRSCPLAAGMLPRQSDARE